MSYFLSLIQERWCSNINSKLIEERFESLYQYLDQGGWKEIFITYGVFQNKIVPLSEISKQYKQEKIKDENGNPTKKIFEDCQFDSLERLVDRIRKAGNR